MVDRTECRASRHGRARGDGKSCGRGCGTCPASYGRCSGRRQRHVVASGRLRGRRVRQAFVGSGSVTARLATAERSAQFAGLALTKVQRWLHERCLGVRDQRSGLFRPTGREWNYQDTAADCYPFYVWAAFYTDQHLLDTVMVEALAAEQRLCNHLDRLPVSYDMDAGAKIDLPLDRVIFGASEYVKDGLTPIVEITGKNRPWYERLCGLVDDIFKHASVETPYGLIPSDNVEVNGDLLQVLPRLYSMTGDKKYLDWAHRLADHYLLPGKFVPSHLSDHGCEIIGGLGLLFAVDSTACPEKCAVPAASGIHVR